MEKNCKTCGGTGWVMRPSIHTACPEGCEQSYSLSQGYTTCTGIIDVRGYYSACGQKAQTTSYQCGRLIPINAASNISPDLCCGIYPADSVASQGGKREMFEKVYVKIEADLPKEDGDYFGMEKGSTNSFMSVLDFKTDEELRDGNSAYWIKFVEWWLRPVE